MSDIDFGPLFESMRKELEQLSYVPEWQSSLAKSLRERLPFLTSERRIVFFGVPDHSTLPVSVPICGGVIHKLFNCSAWMEMNDVTCKRILKVLEGPDLTKYVYHNKFEELIPKNNK